MRIFLLSRDNDKDVESAKASGIANSYVDEDRILVPSPKIRTYDLQPEMNVPEVTEHLVAAITGGKDDAIICNYANCDRVGHTGIIDAAILAVEAVDRSLQRVVDALKSVSGSLTDLAPTVLAMLGGASACRNDRQVVGQVCLICG